MKREAAKVDVLVSDFAMAKPPPIDIPAMICQQEKNYFYWLTSNHAPGIGAVVEFGTWLGSSSAHLSAGLGGRELYCYDHFVWSDQYNAKSEIKLKDGEDFSDIFLQNMERCGAKVIVNTSKMTDITWDGGPIELLILDAPKQASDLARLLTVFGPSLIPGQTRIALQDYQHFPSYQISLVMDAIRSSVALEHVVVAVNSNLQPNTVSFFVSAPIDTAELAEVVNTFKTWSAERIRETWSRIMEPLPEQVRARMAPGLALFLYDAGHEEEATKALAAISMDRLMLVRWDRMAGLHVSKRYPKLFESVQEARVGSIGAGERKALLAAEKAVGAARAQGDQTGVVDGLIAVLEITPNDEGTKERLASAALSARQEQRVLDYLVRHGQADLSAPRIESLFKRVYMACKTAVQGGDFDLAHRCLETLTLVDDKHPWVEALRASLAKLAAPAARSA